MPATIPYRGNVIVARMAASHDLAASHKIAPKGRSNKVARMAASHDLAASYKIAPKGRSNRIADAIEFRNLWVTFRLRSYE